MSMFQQISASQGEGSSIAAVSRIVSERSGESESRSMLTAMISEGGSEARKYFGAIAEKAGEKIVEVIGSAQEPNLKNRAAAALQHLGKRIGESFSDFDVRVLNNDDESPMRINTRQVAAACKSQDPQSKPELIINQKRLAEVGGLEAAFAFILPHEAGHQVIDSFQQRHGATLDTLLKPQAAKFDSMLGFNKNFRTQDIWPEIAADAVAIAMIERNPLIGSTPAQRREHAAQAWLVAQEGLMDVAKKKNPAEALLDLGRQYAAGVKLACGPWESAEKHIQFNDTLVAMRGEFTREANRLLGEEMAGQLLGAIGDAQAAGISIAENSADMAKVLLERKTLEHNYGDAQKLSDYTASVVALFGSKPSAEARAWLPGGEKYAALETLGKKFHETGEALQREVLFGIREALSQGIEMSGNGRGEADNLAADYYMGLVGLG